MTSFGRDRAEQLNVLQFGFISSTAWKIMLFQALKPCGTFSGFDLLEGIHPTLVTLIV